MVIMINHDDVQEISIMMSPVQELVFFSKCGNHLPVCNCHKGSPPKPLWMLDLSLWILGNLGRQLKPQYGRKSTS